MSDVMTCPQNNGQLSKEPDRWLDDRWTADSEKAAADRQAYLDRNPSSTVSPTGGEWLWSWGPPRTCSYCGGIHPDDAIKLIVDGWEVDPTTKPYKRYLQPPGSKQKHEAIMRAMDEGRPDFSTVPSVWSPTPPVKLYTYHFSPEQIDRFNAAINAK